MTTIREITFVYPLLRTISLAADIEPARRTFVNDFLAKLQAVIDAHAVKEQKLFDKYSQSAAVVAGGDASPGKPAQQQPPAQANEPRRRPLSPEQSTLFRAEFKTYKSGEVNLRLNAAENALFEQLLWNALSNGYEDFPKV